MILKFPLTIIILFIDFDNNLSIIKQHLLITLSTKSNHFTNKFNKLLQRIDYFIEESHNNKNKDDDSDLYDSN